MLREIKQLMLTPEIRRHVVFLEDYDLQLARWLVTGVDVWLNNPGGAAGGQRHLGHQGGGQRPTQRQHPRWLVGGGLRS